MSQDEMHEEVREALQNFQAAINKALRYEPDVMISFDSIDVTCIGDPRPAYARHLSLVVTKKQVIE